LPFGSRFPTEGFSVQVTPVLPVPPTFAVKLCVCDAVRAVVVGLIPIVTTGGVRVTEALAERAGSAWLAAVTTTLCALETEAGAVYRPLVEIVPTAGLSDQVTLLFPVPVTVAVNCCV
jgi:hypothetical protein